MNMRVTGQTQINSALFNLQRQAADAARIQGSITSGLRVQKASDNPAEYTAIRNAQASSLRTATYQQTIDDATADLNVGVSALVETNRVLSRARQLAQQGANSANGPHEYEAYATEVDSLLQQMIELANTRNDGRYLFGGTDEDTPPFRIDTVDPSGKPASVVYDGAAEPASGRISPTQTVVTKFVGSDVFQASGAEAFTALIGLRDDLRNTSLSPSEKATAVDTRLAALEAAHHHIGKTVGEQSASLSGMEGLRNRLSDLKLYADTRIGELESTDYAEAVLRLKEQEATFQATLGVTGRLLQTSLLDFLR